MTLKAIGTAFYLGGMASGFTAGFIAHLLGYGFDTILELIVTGLLITIWTAIIAFVVRENKK